MKRIQVAITKKPGEQAYCPFRDFITDCYHTGLYKQCCGESTFSDLVDVVVFYGEDERWFVALLENNKHAFPEKFELSAMEVPDAYWQELKTAKDNYDDDAEFCARLRAKFF